MKKLHVFTVDEIPSSLPIFGEVTSGELTDRQHKTRTVKETLEGAGLNQAITYSLVSKEHAKDFAHYKNVQLSVY